MGQALRLMPWHPMVPHSGWPASRQGIDSARATSGAARSRRRDSGKRVVSTESQGVVVAGGGKG